MSLTTASTVLALFISVVSLAASSVVSARQIRLAHNSNLLPVVVELFRETRQSEFSRAIEYIKSDLARDHSPEFGYRRLPDEPLGHVRRVSLFYDDVGKLVAHGIVDERLIIGSYGPNILNMWEVLAPYIYRERELTTKAMIYFEDLAHRARVRPQARVHAELGLRSAPPPSSPAAE
ncbi:hypothetical protein ACIBU0_16700 [Streptomyces sp. NPDC049627]|uniref:DUF4760 domain-containing protein n=1 Tax=Streptomyces sp. NPDC049627 TaxID=3365595 RepID=UPI0037A6B0F8